MATFKQIREAAKYNPYAIGMAAAKKKAGITDKHAEGLPKAVIVKGHAIAKKIKANEDFDAVLETLELEIELESYTVEEIQDFMASEAYEQLDELDKKTLGNYITKAHDQLMKHTSTVNFKGGRGDSDAFAYAHDDTAVRKTANRTKGMSQAVNKLVGAK